jgi:hypothetical protein
MAAAAAAHPPPLCPAAAIAPPGAASSPSREARYESRNGRVRRRHGGSACYAICGGIVGSVVVLRGCGDAWRGAAEVSQVLSFACELRQSITHDTTRHDTTRHDTTRHASLFPTACFHTIGFVLALLLGRVVGSPAPPHIETMPQRQHALCSSSSPQSTPAPYFLRALARTRAGYPQIKPLPCVSCSCGKPRAPHPTRDGGKSKGSCPTPPSAII